MEEEKELRERFAGSQKLIFKFRPLADYPPIVQHLIDSNNEGLLARLINSITHSTQNLTDQKAS